MKFSISLLVLVFLSSCTPLTPEQAYQHEYDTTKALTYHDFDKYSNSYTVSSPREGGDILSVLTSYATVENQLFFKDNQYVLISKLSAMDWYFISKAEVLGLGQVELHETDREAISGDRVIEKLGIILTPEIIEYAKTNGLQIRYSGTRGNIETELSKGYINGFIDSVVEGINKKE